ncbi:sulfurtransferase [Hanstruepera ponticola]|uniref:sulfurtransferase n=1 Tax=Hanstruepera ponticola TaxID=2042995 RepID=UPI00177C4614|nr:sulfurtransferase [Hanstruepera ponticola]
MVITKFHKPIVSVEWLHKNKDATNLVILDASIPKVTENTNSTNDLCIPKARFFDLKNKFSNTAASFPTTYPTQDQFESEARNLGINNNSFLVIYDDKGIYSSPRAWWLFKSFGFENVAVLDGGLPAWIEAFYPLSKKEVYQGAIGNFTAKKNQDCMCFFDDVQKIVKNRTHQVIDARSQARFMGQEPEPREGLRSGTIPNSKNIPFQNLLVNGRLKSENEIRDIFQEVLEDDKPMVFSCGSGITACVLALGAELTGYKNMSVYDGSWTEYGSLINNNDMDAVQNWSKKELVAYILFYAANSNLSETNKERNVILSKVDMNTFQMVYDEFKADNDYQCIQKIIQGMETHEYSRSDLNQLFVDIKVLFFADGEFDQVEHVVFNWLKRIINEAA